MVCIHDLINLRLQFVVLRLRHLTSIQKMLDNRLRIIADILRHIQPFACEKLHRVISNLVYLAHERLNGITATT